LDLALRKVYGGSVFQERYVILPGLTFKAFFTVSVALPITRAAGRDEFLRGHFTFPLVSLIPTQPTARIAQTTGRPIMAMRARITALMRSMVLG
jgi:hypothetical protein